MGEQNFLETGIDAVKQASKVILKYSNNLHKDEITIKSDGSPVTIADKKAEELIKNIITKKFPDHSFMGEEGSNLKTDSQYTWILDPIDGTRYFSRGLPYFTTELALVKNGEVIVGISYNHSSKELLTAIKNKGSYLNKAQKLQISNTTNLKNTLASAGSIKHFDELNVLPNLAKLNWDISQLRGLEESRMYFLLAQGTIDCVIMPKGYSWDFAAASLILEEAGAKVTNIFGEKIDFLSNKPHSMLATNKELHPKILNYFMKK